MSTDTVQPKTLMTRLNNDWAAIAHRVRDFGELGVQSGGEVLAQIRSTSGDRQDALLYPLVCSAHAGDLDAERLLVQVLIPAAQRMAHRVRNLYEFDRGDRVGLAIAAAWEAVRSYKLHRHSRVMANLTMTMLSVLTGGERKANDKQVANQTITVADDVLEVLAGEWTEPPIPAEVRLARVFTWAVDTGVITKTEMQLLARAALGDGTHKELAAELGVTVASLRHRVDRIRQRLQAAVRDRL